jgi:hypothetical protein
VALPAGTQRGVAGLGDGVGLSRHPGPVVEGVADARVARRAHHDHPLLATAACDGSDACKCSECGVVSGVEWPSRFPEQRRRHDHADPWHGLDDRDVALLVHLSLGRLRGEILEAGLEAGLAGLDLLVDEAHPFAEQFEVGDGCVSRARRREDRRASQQLQNLVGVGPTDAVVLQQLVDASWPCRDCCCVMRDQPEQARSPVFARIRRHGEECREVARELSAHLVDDRVAVTLQLVVHARPLAEFDDLGWLRGESAEQVAIGPQRVGEHHGVAPIVLGPGDGEAIPEAIELFRVDREDDEAAVEKCLDDGAVRHLDRHRDGRGVTELVQPGAEVGESVATVLEGVGAHALSLGIHGVDLVLDRGPIDANVVLVVAVHSSSRTGALRRRDRHRAPRRPLYWCSWHGLPTGRQSAAACRGTGPPQELWRLRGRMVALGRLPDRPELRCRRLAFSLVQGRSVSSAARPARRGLVRPPGQRPPMSNGSKSQARASRTWTCRCRHWSIASTTRSDGPLHPRSSQSSTRPRSSP